MRAARVLSSIKTLREAAGISIMPLLWFVDLLKQYRKKAWRTSCTQLLPAVVNNTV